MTARAHSRALELRAWMLAALGPMLLACHVGGDVNDDGVDTDDPPDDETAPNVTVSIMPIELPLVTDVAAWLCPQSQPAGSCAEAFGPAPDPSTFVFQWEVRVTVQNLGHESFSLMQTLLGIHFPNAMPPVKDAACLYGGSDGEASWVLPIEQCAAEDGLSEWRDVFDGDLVDVFPEVVLAAATPRAPPGNTASHTIGIEGDPNRILPIVTPELQIAIDAWFRTGIWNEIPLGAVADFHPGVWVVWPHDSAHPRLFVPDPTQSFVEMLGAN